MHKFVGGLQILLSMAVAVGSAQDTPATPAEEFNALRKEFGRAASSGGPMTDSERMKFVGQAYRQRFELAQKFLELAEKFPDDPIAFEALTQAVWQVNGTPWPVELVGEDVARGRAFELLQRDHLDSDKIGPLCSRVSCGFCQEYETFLRAVIAKNPHENVKGIASLSLGRFLNNRVQRIDLCKEQPKLAKEFADFFGEEYLAELLRQDRGQTVQEFESVLEEASKKYADVRLSDDETIGERAMLELFAIRNLSVGKEAPDIEGEDQEGQRFKLSDYRGKVVLLDFWSYV